MKSINFVFRYRYIYSNPIQASQNHPSPGTQGSNLTTIQQENHLPLKATTSTKISNGPAKILQDHYLIWRQSLPGHD